MYHVIGTGLTAILLYLISYLFFRIGYYSLQFHRKIWNSILAVTFLLTALAGLFMALQLNYKWNIPIIKSLLKLHVEFGIGMSVTGMFHFIWHLSYFGKIFSRSDNDNADTGIQKQSIEYISINLFIIGFVSSSIQLLLMREIMIIAGGYELITGIFLGSWLIGSAMGALLGDKSQLSDIKRIILIFSLSPIVSILLLILLSRLFLNTGETPSFLVSTIYTLIVLCPYCIASGFTFIKLVSIAKYGRNFTTGKSFSIETTGGVASGLAISLLTAGMLNTYQILFLIVILSLAYVLLSYWIQSIKKKIYIKLSVIVLSAGIIFFNPDILIRQILLPAIKVTGTEDTPYGNITHGSYKGEKSLFYNQRLLAYNDDVMEREEDIHYAMLQSKSPEKVILISGSPSSHIPEISKYPVRKIIHIEMDPALTRTEIISPDIFSGELVIVNKDALNYIRQTSEFVDVIILLIPPPSTLLLNRYYTTEFFSDIKKRLKDDGVFLCSPGTGDNYFNKEALILYSSIFNSLEVVFRNVKPVVGNKLYFLASDKDLSLSFCELTGMKNIKNFYVSSDFFDDVLVKKKSEDIDSLLDHRINQNRSMFPAAALYIQSYNFSKNMDEKIPAIILMALVFGVPMLIIRRKNLIMYFSAAALAGFEIIILLTLQLIIGNMYQLTGLIIAGLMSGLAIGAVTDIKLLKSFSINIIAIGLIVYYACIGFFYHYILGLQSGIISVIILTFLVFLPAILTGNLFRELSMKPENLNSSPAIYSADLAGSAMGFLLVSGFTIPALGIKGSIYLLSSIIIAGVLGGTIRSKL